MAAGAAVVSVSMGVMKPVLAKLATLMGDEYKKLKGLRKAVSFLQLELGDMDALLQKMDDADELDPQAKKWRKDIIEMSYSIEDRIDEFIRNVGEPNKKIGMLKKACKFLRTINDRHRLANQFQEIKIQVMEASERRRRYMLDQSISTTTRVFVDPRLSALYENSTSLVGIKTQKDALVKWVMDEIKQLKVMSIVGLGGLGKTTLANEVYREVGGQVNCKAFVSVSQKPDMTRLFNSVLFQLGKQTDPNVCMQDLINKVREHLQDKRYLIVVDDLWSTEDWDIISCAFPTNNQHSRIMITTRIIEVAKKCCDDHKFIHNMQPLSETNSRQLFFDRIFGSEDTCPSEFMNASCEILKKCGGLPLAIITMASMLACQQTRLDQQQWEYIQSSLASIVATDSSYGKMMSILDLSYKNLPRYLKTCFLYLGSYPEDHQISRAELLGRWVAEGFVSNSNGQDVWDVAESYLNQLVNRSMIQPTYDYLGKVSGYRVHDMFLELILKRCTEDNFLSSVNGPEAVAEAQDKVIHRLNIVRGFKGTKDVKVEVSKTSVRNLSQIRSLTLWKDSKSLQLMMLIMPKYLRVLVLNGVLTKKKIDLSCISQMSQLRYLQIVGADYIAELPCEICGLRLLETLDFSQALSFQAGNLERLPIGQCTRLPDWIVELKFLRTLRGFCLPMDSLESIMGLSKLTTLSDLELHLPKGEVFASLLPIKEKWIAALSTSLENLGNLKWLDVMDNSREVALCADMLSTLSPPFHKLERLDMKACTFSRVPKWVSHLKNICTLKLGLKQILHEDVSVLGTMLPSLLELILRITCILRESVVIGCSSGFAVLKMFEMNCDGISYLTFEAGAMPELRVLKLVFDPYEWDKAAPSGLQHLPNLEKIDAQRAAYLTSEVSTFYDVAEDPMIKDVFQDALPTLSAINLVSEWELRPAEEKDWFSGSIPLPDGSEIVVLPDDNTPNELATGSDGSKTIWRRNPVTQIEAGSQLGPSSQPQLNFIGIKLISVRVLVNPL